MNGKAVVAGVVLAMLIAVSYLIYSSHQSAQAQSGPTPLQRAMNETESCFGGR